MSIHAIESDSTLEAWRAGCTLLLASGGKASNLMTTILRPCMVDDRWLEQHSPVRYKAGADDARDVANTLFPQRTYERAASRADFLFWLSISPTVGSSGAVQFRRSVRRRFPPFGR
jgi:hypothetical protein